MSEAAKTTETSVTALTTLSEDERQLALGRFHLLQPHLEQGVALTTLTEQTGLAYRTAVRWVSLYRRFGLAALARKGRADKGARRVLSPQMQQVVEGLALQKPPLPIATLHRQVCKLAEERGEKRPSYSMVYDTVTKLPADLVTLAHEGAKAYADEFELVHRREADAPNAIWQADHTLLDIVVQNEGKATKPWLTVIIDDYSRAITGYFLSCDAPSSLQTALALRQAIWRKSDARWRVCGIPQVLYTDNGSDFTSQHLEQVAADLRMRLIFSLPGRPRGRGRIERFFSSLNQLCLSGLPGYIPAGSGATPTPTIDLLDLDTRIREFIVATYHRRVHSETRIPPLERWEGQGFLPQMPTSLEQLDLLLLTVVKSRKVHPDGIRFQGFRYVDTTLAAYVGEVVTLRYDPRDLAEVRVFHQGQFLCRAICPDLAGETVPLRDVLRARSQRRQQLRATLRDRKKVVDALVDLKRGQEEPSLQASEKAPDTISHANIKQGRTEPASEPATPLRRYVNE